MKATLFGREPVVIIAAVNAVVQLAVGFGLELSGEQQGLISAGVTAVLALFVRQQVTPTEQVAVTVDDMKDALKGRFLP